MNFEDFFRNIESFSGKGNSANKKIGLAWQAFMEKIREEPSLWMSLIQASQQKQLEIISQLNDTESPNDPVVAPGKGDRRFQAEQWQKNPFYSFLMQSYLFNSKGFLEIVEKVNLPEKQKDILRFTAKQYIDAVSPTNFPTTNPEVFEKAVETGGKSFTQGMQNMLEDMQSGIVKNTDSSAFTIGDNVATTPGKIVMQNAVMQLIEYAPTTTKVHQKPLLIVPPCINKYYILDLTEEKSFVRAAIDAGQRVFLISWVNADHDIARLGWDDYLRDGVMAAMDAVRAITKQDKINTLGFCIGGTLLASALAALTVNKEYPAQSMTLLASMLDFSDTGEIGLFIDEKSVAEREAQYANGGLMDGRQLARGFAALRPNDLVWPYVIGNYYQGTTPPPFDLLFWNSDSTNLPGPMFAEYLRKTYLENQLTNGKAIMCDVSIDLSSIKIPVYAVACEKDHIVPWKTAYISARAANPKSHFVLAASGHIAGIVNPPAKRKGWYMTAPANKSLTTDAEKWKASATQNDGSWWNNWLQWLNKQSGKEITAPRKPGNLRYPPIEDAPGHYVTRPRPDAIPPSNSTDQQGDLS